MSELLGDRADDLDVDRLGQSGKFLERVGGSPGLRRALDGDQQRVLGRVVGGEWGARNGSLLGLRAATEGEV
jgi:hypothetical protein